MRLPATVILLVSLSFASHAFPSDFLRRENLSGLDNSTVYSIAQDSTKALWISCSSGLMRYNGNSLRRIYDVLPMQNIAYDGGSTLWAVSYNGLVCVDILSFKSKVIGSPSHTIDYASSKVCVEPSRTLLLCDTDVWTVGADTLSYLLTIPSSEDIGYAGIDRKGNVYVSSGNALWRISGHSAFPVVSLPEKVSSFHFDTYNNIWVGFMHGGLAEYDESFNLLAYHELQATNVRTFCDDGKGNVWAGSAASLYRIPPDGNCQSAPESSPVAQPITSILCDSSGNIWAGTFYSGVYMYPGGDAPFDNLDTPPSLRNVRCACPVGNDRIAVLTDGNGAWIYGHDGSFSKMPGSDAFKFISCIAEKDVLYAGLYRNGLVRLSKNAIAPVVLNTAEGMLPGVSANALLHHGDKLYLASDEGLYVFSFSGDEITLFGKKLEGIDNQILSLGLDEEEHLWAGGRGLFVLDSEDVPHKVADGYYPAISCSSSGIWASEFGKGISLIHTGGIIQYDDRNAGIRDNYISFIHPLPGGRFLLGARTGISIFDSLLGRSINYSMENGLDISSARTGCAIDLDGGHCLMFGTDGAATIRVSDIPKVSCLPALTLDVIETLGTASMFRPDASRRLLSLRPGQSNLMLDYSSFDYSGLYSQNYEYTVSGSHREWIPFDPSSPLPLIGLKPGNYYVWTRPAGSAENMSSFSFRILRPWYISILALVVYLLVFAGVALYIVYNLYRRLLLSQMLESKEAENEERTRLFIKLSHELRTPLTSVIGQLSLFFKRYGASLQGNALLRQSYKGALEMNRIVSNFLEVEDSLKEDVDDLPAFDRAEMYPSGQGEYTMLIADDNADMRALLQNVFSGEYKLLMASNGREAYIIARSQQPDIIVSDVMMPEMDGLTLCATLRKDYETRHIPIVLITAHASERHKLEGLELGADDYIAKPFSVELLRAKCRALIINRKAIVEHTYMSGIADIPASDNKREKFLNAAIGAVERNLTSRDLSVSLLCREMGLSKTTLTNRLKDYSGMSPRDFIEDVRLRYAARMIQDGEIRLSDIADELNFSSPKYFSIRFRKKFGLSPRDYAKGGGKA